MNIRLELSDWLYNAGLVGVAKILEESNIDYKKEKNYIEFDDKVLDEFENMYFNYFTKTYLKFTSWYKIVDFESYIDIFDVQNINEKDLEKINLKIEEIKKRLTSNSYKSAYIIIGNSDVDLINEEKKLQKIKKTKNQIIDDIKDNVKEQLNNIKKIIEFLKKDEVKKIILAKNVIYDIIQNFWADVSFLNKNNSQNNMFEEYKNYFVNSAKGYLNNNHDKYKYSCFTCENRVSKLSKPEAYDLTWINKIGVDMSRKSSHFWNYYGDSFICPLCNLVYSCIPAGFTVLKDKGIFINENSSSTNLISINKHSLNEVTTIDELEEESYYTIAKTMNQAQIDNFDKEEQNIQIIKFDGSNERRPYSFNLLSKDKLRIIFSNKGMLESFIKIYIKIGKNEYVTLYKEVIQRLYEGKNQFDLISKLMYLYLDQKFNKIYLVDMLIKINDDFIGRSCKTKMVYHKKIDEFKGLGLNLRNGYVKKEAEKKLVGITYKLTNALRTKNQASFMDTLINSYMYLGKSIPTDFIEMLKDIDKFQTIGYSFLIGLQGEEKKANSEKKENGVNE